MDRFHLKETAPFMQFSSVKITDDFNPLFDIEKIPDETLQSYCEALFHKAITTNNSNIPAFINHHCNLVKNPVLWLNKFEKLISENEEIFHEAKKDSKLMKYQTCIELKRNKLEEERKSAKNKKPPTREINALSEERYFSFKETKLKVLQFQTIQEQVYFLTSEIYDYKTEDIEMVNYKLPNFADECEKLIGKIQTLSKMKAEMQPAQPTLPQSLMPYSKLKINCNVNQIVDVFYQLSREMFVDGRPYIEGNVNDLIAVIVNSFEDKGGLPLSPLTVKTILKPAREDKRPNSEKRIDLSDI